MATIQSSINLFDGIAPVLQININSINVAISSSERMGQVSGAPFDITSLRSARTELIQAESDITRVEDAIRRAGAEQEQLNERTQQGKKAAEELKELWGSFSGALGKIGIELDPKAILSEADKMNSAGNTLQARTGMQGVELEAAKQSTKNLYIDNMGESWDDVATSMATVHQITGRTGVELEEMTRAGMLLRDTFGYDVTGSMQTAEIMQKQLGVSAGQAFDLIVQGAQAGLDTNGDLLDTINEYSVYFNKLGLDSNDMFNMLVNGAQSGTFSVDKLGNAIKEFSSKAIDGSADTQEGFQVIGLDAGRMIAAFGSGGEAARLAFQETVNALSQMEDPVNRNIAGVNLFGSMWGDLGYNGIMALANLNGSVELTTDNLENLNRVKYDSATNALGSLARTINTGLSGAVGNMVEVMKNHINDFTTGLQGNVGGIVGIFGEIGLAAGFVGRLITDNWSVIEPVIWGIIAALGFYAIALAILKGAQIAGLIITGISAIATAIHTAFTTKWTFATFAATMSQKGLNAALLACPITWILLLIIGLIAAIYVVVAVINKLAGTSISATGLICGAFAMLGAFLYNTFFVQTWNMFAEFANFIGNFMNNPVAAVKVLFYNLAIYVINRVAYMAHAIENLVNNIPGVKIDLTSKLDSLKAKLEADVEKIKDASEWKEYVKKKDKKDLGDSFAKGYQFGKDLANRKDKTDFDNIKDSYNNLPPESRAGGAPDTWNGINNNTGNTAANTAAMADSMDIIDEDLKYMRDAAEQEIINRFTLAELKVDVSNNNTLKTQSDFNDVNRRLGEVTSEILAAAAEGGHF